jgi:hypothetical protein
MTTSADLARATIGGLDYTAQVIEYDPAGPTGTPGTPVSRTGFVPLQTNTMKTMYEKIKVPVQTNNRFAERINIVTYATNSGDVSFPINATLGLEYFQAALGGRSSLAAITTTSTAIATTVNGRTLIPAVGAFSPGAPLEVNVGSNLVPTTVISSTGTLVIVPELPGAMATAASSTSIKQPALYKFANSLLPLGVLNQLPTLDIERVIGGQWGLLFPGVLVGGLDFKFDAGLGAVTAHLWGNVKKQNLAFGDLTAYAPSSGDEATALNAFTAINTLSAVAGDPSGTGSTRVGAAVGLSAVSAVFDNALYQFKVDGNPIVQCVPGDACKLDISYNEISTDRRPAILDDLIALNQGVTFNYGYGKNYGTLASPAYKYVMCYSPNVLYDDSAVDSATGKLADYANKASGLVVRGLPQDLLQIFVSQ